MSHHSSLKSKIALGSKATSSTAILLVGVIFFMITCQWEESVVYDLWQNPWPTFRDVMSESLFEGSALGVSDFGVLGTIVCFLIWIYGSIAFRTRPGQFPWSRSMKFVWTSSLLASLVTVHSLKWIVSRARPKIYFDHVISHQSPSDSLPSFFLFKLHWPGFMPIDGPRGYSWNSLPSGHTASCAVFLAVFYLLWTKHPRPAVAVFLLVIFFSILMSVARSMAGMHWLSDSVASFFLVWAIMNTMAQKMNIIPRSPRRGP